MNITFKDILNQKSWKDYNQYIEEGITEYVKSLSDYISHSQKMKTEIRKFIDSNFQPQKIPHDLSDVEELLTSGQVIGIDGTIAKHKTISGTMAQIGVIAVNYLNEKIQHSFFISEAKFKEEISEITEYLYAHEPGNQIFSNLVIRALLFYRERELGIKDKFANCYKLYHGPLLPFELMTGLGRLRALEITVTLLEQLIRNKKCFSIVSRSQNDAFLRLGIALNPGEYIMLRHTNVGREIQEKERFMREEKWREEELYRINHFLSREASKIQVGIIKVARRPYVFHAHRDYFDIAARIIARDAKFQHEKGFPLLIDYADSLCSTLFKSSDFNRIIEYKLAGENEYFSEMPEDSLRQKY
jgi:hypothetical protein